MAIWLYGLLSKSGMYGWMEWSGYPIDPYDCYLETHTRLSSTVDCTITYVKKIFHVYLLNIRGTMIVFFIGADVLGTAGCGNLSSGGTSR